MKKLLLVISCVLATVQLHAQESVALVLNAKPNAVFEITTEDKNSMITNLNGNKELIALLKQEGSEFPKYETQEFTAKYMLNWKKADKNKATFELDLVKQLIRNFKANALESTLNEGEEKGITNGYLGKEGVKATKDIEAKYKNENSDILALLDDLFNSQGYPSKPIKVNDTFSVQNNKVMKLSEDNEVDVLTREDIKFSKIENKKAYLVILSTITSESKSVKFAKVKGKGTKEVIYNIEKQYIESVSGSTNVTMNIETEESLTINVTNNTTQKVKVKLKE
ncbi:hypothetical protein LNQ81_12335 [Myroides sp. M-43]|uniref:hypothetical protein n=1 Tax=Myroides oncorhynchi TaxID=2893756 RepID=UPI001E3E3477|nr:hypothetical protein [Myroides oncorhynchi]MCC9043459.1 hypothetical protein [Myroides oncorhynchi]